MPPNPILITQGAYSRLFRVLRDLWRVHKGLLDVVRAFGCHNAIRVLQDKRAVAV